MGSGRVGRGGFVGIECLLILPRQGVEVAHGLVEISDLRVAVGESGAVMGQSLCVGVKVAGFVPGPQVPLRRLSQITARLVMASHCSGTTTRRASPGPARQFLGRPGVEQPAPRGGDLLVDELSDLVVAEVVERI